MTSPAHEVEIVDVFTIAHASTVPSLPPAHCAWLLHGASAPPCHL